MAFTEFLFDREMIEEKTARYQRNLRKNIGPDAKLTGFGLGVINDRLEKDSLRYRDYGPYWPALKRVMAKYGVRFMPEDADGYFTELSRTYVGKTDDETIIMAETFREYYLDHYFIHTNSFVLDDDSQEEYVITDSMLDNPFYGYEAW